jgi:hypothetical protein
MIENLSEMVKNQNKDNMFSTVKLDIPEENKEIEKSKIVYEKEMEEQIENIININYLSTWIRTQIFDNIRLPNVKLQGINPDKQLIVISIDESKDIDNQRKIYIFDKADEIPVLDLPASDMQIYQNTFRIIYPIKEEGIEIKSYRIRQGLTNVFCKFIDDLSIPYAFNKLKKNDTGLTSIPEPPKNDYINNILNRNPDIEKCKILYKQFKNARNIHSNKDIFNWLLNRQKGIIDVHHHIQIDNVLIELLK